MPRAYLILNSPGSASAHTVQPLSLAERFAAATAGRCLVHTRRLRVIAGSHDGGMLTVVEFASPEELQRGLDSRDAVGLLGELRSTGALRLWSVSGVEPEARGPAPSRGGGAGSPPPLSAAGRRAYVPGGQLAPGARVQPAYALALVDITDRERLDRLWNLVALLVNSRDGRFLVRGDDMRVIVGPPYWRRIVLVELPSLPELEDAVGAPGLEDVLALAQDSAQVDLWIMPGVEEEVGGE